jgi:hypothetical protein
LLLSRTQAGVGVHDRGRICRVHGGVVGSVQRVAEVSVAPPE